MKNKRKGKATFKFTAIVLCFVFVISAVVAVSYKSALKVLYPEKYTDLVEEYSAKYNIDKNLLYAVIKTESGFDNDAHSNADALGLTQITPDTFKWLQTKTGESLDENALTNSETSIKYGALFISMLMSEFNDTKTAIAAYHAGRGQVNKWLKDKNYSSDGKNLKNIPYADTAHYVNKVLKTYSIYNNLYD